MLLFTFVINLLHEISNLSKTMSILVLKPKKSKLAYISSPFRSPVLIMLQCDICSFESELWESGIKVLNFVPRFVQIVFLCDMWKYLKPCSDCTFHLFWGRTGLTRWIGFPSSVLKFKSYAFSKILTIWFPNCIWERSVAFYHFLIDTDFF